jgi:hypothetical protein
MPTERPPVVGVVSANFFRDRECPVVSVSDSYSCNLDFLDLEPLLFLSSSSSIVLTRLSGDRYRLTSSRKIEVTYGHKIINRKYVKSLCNQVVNHSVQNVITPTGKQYMSVTMNL